MPHRNIPRREERLIIADVSERFAAVFGRSYNGRYWSGRVEHLRVMRAVFIGALRGKPRTTAAIAEATGLPRSTMQRKLTALEADGMILRVGNKWTIPDQHLMRAPLALDDLAALIIEGADRLQNVKKK